MTEYIWRSYHSLRLKESSAYAPLSVCQRIELNLIKNVKLSDDDCHWMMKFKLELTLLAELSVFFLAEELLFCCFFKF